VNETPPMPEAPEERTPSGDNPKKQPPPPSPLLGTRRTVPWKPPRYCATPGCGNLTPGGHCPEHRSAKEKERRERETWRDYNSPEWKHARATVLRLEPLCRFCGERATVVDHIVPLKEKGTHAIENLRPLCKTCHDRRTYGDTLAKQPEDGSN